MDEWRQINDWPYYICEQGYVMRYNKILNRHMNNGIPSVYICINGRTTKYAVKNLVWRTFRGPIPHGYMVYNKDQNPENCSLDNLGLRIQNGKPSTSKRIAIPDMPPLTKLNDEGAIRLWKEIVDLAVRDAVKEVNQTQGSALNFLKNDVPVILGISAKEVGVAVEKRISNYGKRTVEEKPEKPKESWRERCKKCKYKMVVTGLWESSLACGYLYETGHRRGCPGSECDKFEEAYEKQRKRRSF